MIFGERPVFGGQLVSEGRQRRCFNMCGCGCGCGCVFFEGNSTVLGWLETNWWYRYFDALAYSSGFNTLDNEAMSEKAAMSVTKLLINSGPPSAGIAAPPPRPPPPPPPPSRLP